MIDRPITFALKYLLISPSLSSSPSPLSHLLFVLAMASLPLIRPALRFLASKTSAKPIETVVVTFALTTYAYFFLLQVAKYSSFLSPSSPFSNLKPSLALWDASAKQWSEAPNDLWDDSSVVGGGRSKVELQPVIISLDPPRHHRTHQFGPYADLSSSSLDTAVHNFTRFLTYDFASPSGVTYSSICYPRSPATPRCLTSLEPPLPNSRTRTLLLAFNPNTPQRSHWATSLAGRSFKIGEYMFTIERQEERIDQMRGVKWFPYATRTMILRFYDLAKKADSADIFVVLLGYILMHGTFANLFLRARKLGSNFWLGEFTFGSTSTFSVDAPLWPRVE